MPDSPKDSSSLPWFAERRNIILIMVVVLFLLSGMTCFLLSDYHRSHLELQLKEDRISANLLSLILEEYVFRLEKTLESYAQRPLLLQAAKNRNRQNARQHLINLTKNNPDIDSVVLSDRQGNIWSTYPEYPSIIGKNFAHRDWYKGVSKDWKPYVSEAIMRVVAEKDLAIQIGVPLLDEKATVAGILLSSQRAIELSRIIERVKFSNGATVNVTDRKGNLIYSSAFDCTRKITPFLFNDVVVKETGKSDRSLAVHDPQSGGRELYLSFSPVTRLGWHVVVGRDSRAILLAEITPLIRITAITVMLFIVIVLSLIYLRKRFMMQQVLARLRMEETLSENERYLGILFKLMINAFVLFDSVFDDAGNFISFRFVFINDAYERITGVKDEEVKGKTIHEVWPGTEASWIKACGEVAVTGVTSSFDMYHGPTGKFYHCNVYRPGKSKDRFCVIFEDITESRRAAEEICRLNEELEQRVIDRTLQLEAANRELEAFSYSVSHDLRTPLRGIDGFSQVLLEEYPNKVLDETGMNYLQRIRMATQHMGKLIDDMLRLAQVSRGELQFQSVDLSHIVRNILDQLQQATPLRVVDVHIQEGMVVQGDYDLVKLAMINLLDNAWKFSGRKERSRIEFGKIEENNQTTFFIRDDGVGFNMRYIDKLFSPFQRLHTMEEFPGTGVGLVIVRRIIERHGGRVWAEGESGKGATVYFSLPDRGECGP